MIEVINPETLDVLAANPNRIPLGYEPMTTDRRKWPTKERKPIEEIRRRLLGPLTLSTQVNRTN
jgi:hypothetical protein